MKNIQAKQLLFFIKDKIRNNPDVVGITFGKRLRNYKETDEECIVIFVKQKKSLSNLSAKQKIPSYFNFRTKDGKTDRTQRVYTDVVQMAEVKSLTAGGSNVMVLGENGTITMAFEHATINYLLSNRHVFAPNINQKNAVMKIRTDTGIIDIANLYSYFHTIDENGDNFFDAALAKVDSINNDLIETYKIINGVSTINIQRIRSLNNRENGIFWLSGSRSLVHSGTLWDIQAGGGTWKVDYDNLGTFYVDKLYALKATAKQGDSGSPVYEKLKDGSVILVGIVVAIAQDISSGMNITLFHSIKDVENGFKKLLKNHNFSFF